MFFEREKILKAKEIMLKIAKGIDPISKEEISKDNFLKDERITRMFFYVAEVLDHVSKSKDRNLPEPTEFVITSEEKQKVIFPDNKIGVNDFSRGINEVIDLNKSKKLKGSDLNKHLKVLGILSEEKTRDGKTRTIINEKSSEFGFESEKKEFEGRTYFQVLINDKGKKYLLENLEDILKAE